MATSNINPNNINGAYPVAGQDNDSQGFRDNFTNIKTSLQAGKDEIEQLMNGTVKLNSVNNMLNGTIVSATLQNARLKATDLSGANTSVTLDHATAQYHRLTPSSALQYDVQLANFPTDGNLGSVMLEFNINPGMEAATIYLVDNYENTTALTGYDPTTFIISFPRAGTYIYEFIGYAGNTTQYSIIDHSRNRLANEIIPYVPTTVQGADGDLAGMVAISGNVLYYCIQDWNGIDPIWSKITGNLSW